MFNEAKKISKTIKHMVVARNEMRTQLKDVALKHYKKSFSDEGFTDKSFWHWTPLKRPRRGRYAGSKILTNTGKLKNSIRTTSNSNKEGFYVNFKSSLKYAKIHNEGLMGKAYGHPFKMPKRMFMGYSTQLDKRLQRIFDKGIKKAFSK
jgi:phage gpG-like protein